jgi:large subunit ribosomal protein L29
MPILRVKEIRGMSHDDRQKRLSELRTELVRLKTMVKAGGSLDNPARVRELRKTIARILTIDNEPAPVKKKEEEEKPKEKPKETKARPKAKPKKPAKKKKPTEGKEQ